MAIIFRFIFLSLFLVVSVHSHANTINSDYIYQSLTKGQKVTFPEGDFIWENGALYRIMKNGSRMKERGTKREIFTQKVDEEYQEIVIEDRIYLSSLPSYKVEEFNCLTPKETEEITNIIFVLKDRIVNAEFELVYLGALNEISRKCLNSFKSFLTNSGIQKNRLKIANGAISNYINESRYITNEGILLLRK